MTKISIILPIYNVEKYLKRCIDSVINQTLEDIEIILATDGPEACDKICEEYAARDNRIKIVSHPGSYGKAFNKSLEIATGEYIGIVETDDWCDSTMFEKLYNKAKETDADVVKCGFYFAHDDTSENKAEIYKQYYFDNINIETCPRFLKSQPSIWNCIYKKEFLLNNNIKMIEKRMSYIDTPFHYETFYKAKKYILLKEPLYYYYQNNENASVHNVKNIDGLNSEIYAYNQAQKAGVFKKYERAFLFSILCHMSWNYFNMDGKMRKLFTKEVMAFYDSLPLTKNNRIILNKWLKKEKIYYSIPSRMYRFIKLVLKNIFSIRNSGNKKFKIITILGLKFKKPRKIKEVRSK